MKTIKENFIFLFPSLLIVCTYDTYIYLHAYVRIIRGCGGGVMIKCDDGLMLHCSHDERERGSLTSPPRLRDLALWYYYMYLYMQVYNIYRYTLQHTANGTHTYLRTRHPLLQTGKLLTLYLVASFFVFVLTLSSPSV